jgi:hypothetical protein
MAIQEREAMTAKQLRELRVGQWLWTWDFECFGQVIDKDADGFTLDIGDERVTYPFTSKPDAFAAVDQCEICGKAVVDRVTHQQQQHGK